MPGRSDGPVRYGLHVVPPLIMTAQVRARAIIIRESTDEWEWGERMRYEIGE